MQSFPSDRRFQPELRTGDMSAVGGAQQPVGRRCWGYSPVQTDGAPSTAARPVAMSGRRLTPPVSPRGSSVRRRGSNPCRRPES